MGVADFSRGGRHNSRRRMTIRINSDVDMTCEQRDNIIRFATVGVTIAYCRCYVLYYRRRQQSAGTNDTDYRPEKYNTG